MVNPCCGSSLQRGVKIMAIVDIVIEALNLGLLIGALIGIYDDSNGNSNEDVSVAANIIAIVLSVMSIGLAVRLLYGAKRRDKRQCRIWFVITCILVTINIITFVANAAAGETQEYDISATILSTLYRLYMLWVVFAFIQELKAGGPEVHHQGVVYYIDPQSDIPNNNAPFNNPNPNNQQHVVYVNVV